MPEYRVNDDLVLITKSSITRGQFDLVRKGVAVDAYATSRDRTLMPPGGRLVRRRGTVAKAKASDKKPLVIVYDANGKAVGLVDPDEINPVQSTTTPGAPPPTAPQGVSMMTGQPLPSPTDPVAQAGAELAKALDGVRLSPANSSTLRKSAADADRAFAELVRELDRHTADQLQNAVAVAGLSLATSLGVQAAGGVAIAKSLALDAADRIRRKPRPATNPGHAVEAAQTAMRAVHARGPTVR